MRYSKIRNVKSPARGTAKSAGIDFFIPEEFNSGQALVLSPGDRTLIPSGIKVNVPEGYALVAFNKSGVASKKGLLVGACVIDEDYQGEVHLNVVNSGNTNVSIEPGEKLLQCILLKVNYELPEEVPVEELYAAVSERGAGAFGSTGTK